ncbi:penicillin-binding protein 1C [Robiginitomaculum antarcticum]|uniref:penicillin-binding protein 1C n=1 Tax=Robiginitomaculum antarcticum TaxID=437507 RepID=UPI00037B3090|nr:penicillin-binding protein 1C [Robiginitomaculum antarcticum]
MARRITYSARLKWGLTFIVSLLILANWVFPPPLEKLQIVSPEVTARDGQWLSGFTVEDGRWRLKARLGDIDPRFTQRLIAIEDKRFYDHCGVDPVAVLRAAKSALSNRKFVSGASTLTMQLARQLEPRPRTLRSKAIEMVRAAQIEMRLSKDEILEAYLTHISYGGNLEGVRAASLSWFGYEPHGLTDAQIALLIALPQAPEARRPDRHAAMARKGRDDIIRRLEASDHLTARQAFEAREAGLPPLRLALPQTAWMTAHRLSANGPYTRSTLDAGLQDRTQRLATAYAAQNPSLSNIAIMIVHNPTREVRASLGSLSRDLPGGWIDMTQRMRSPGSALKPFIFALAFEDGIASPGSKLMDAPTRFGSYQPQNFTRRYHGDVTVEQALQHSLNVPSVIALDQIGSARFEAALQATGINMSVPQRSAEGGGLAVALGGLGVTPEGLATLYTALANGGMAAPLTWHEKQDRQKPKAFISEKSAAQITRILRQAPHPRGHVPSWLSQNAPPIAYKTGTSYGHRDAWAAGYTDEWTVVIWTGRADGAPRYGMTGRDAAAPLLFDVFALLPHVPGLSRPYRASETAPTGLARVLGPDETQPQILFPEDGAQIALSVTDGSKSLPLSALSPDGSALAWYVDGSKLSKSDLDPTATLWSPDKPGFYTLRVVNTAGKSGRARVEVTSLN